jgi:hypothetical protein
MFNCNHPSINIPNIGDKIEILGHPTPAHIFPAGSLGYVSNISIEIIEEYTAAMSLKAQFFRIDKSMKAYRRYELEFPILWDEEIQKDPEFINLIPLDDMEYYVHFRNKKQQLNNVIDLTPEEFLAWASAKGEYLKDRKKQSNKHNYWPEDKAHPINRILRYSHMALEEGIEAVETHFSGDNKQLRVDVVVALREMEAYYFKTICRNTYKYLETAELLLNNFVGRTIRNIRVTSKYLNDLNRKELVGCVRTTRLNILDIIKGGILHV